jgi:hypothetical protein
MTDFLDILKTVGSVSGIFAAAFLLWDRYVKHFPSAIIVPRPLVEGGQHIVLFLLVKNVSDRPILMSWDGRDSSRLRIAKDQSVRGILQVMLRDRTVLSLDSEEAACLPLIKPGNYDEIDPENYLEIEINWKFAQPRIWKVDRRLRGSARKRDLDDLVDGYIKPL